MVKSEETVMEDNVKLTTTMIKGTSEKLLPNFALISTENCFRSRKHSINTRIPMDHCKISCKLKPKVDKPRRPVNNQPK